MVMFSGLNTVADMRNASRQGKAKKATDKMATSTSTAVPTAASTKDKPVTDTSGTAKGGNRGRDMKAFKRQMEFGAQGGKLGPAGAFLGIPFTKRGTSTILDPLSQKAITPGVGREAPLAGATIGGFAIKPTAAKKKPTTGTGIDAPEPDTGWRPSGTNTAFGLQQTEMGVPLQETIGVSKRKR